MLIDSFEASGKAWCIVSLTSAAPIFNPSCVKAEVDCSKANSKHQHYTCFDIEKPVAREGAYRACEA